MDMRKEYTRTLTTCERKIIILLIKKKLFSRIGKGQHPSKVSPNSRVTASWGE
jgi:hypothetical protein